MLVPATAPQPPSEKVAVPLPLVVTVVDPRRTVPCPQPAGSQLELLYTSMTIWRLGVPRRRPLTLVVVDDWSTGALSSAFAPASTSPGSLYVTPSKGAVPSRSRSMPMPAFE